MIIFLAIEAQNPDLNKQAKKSPLMGVFFLGKALLKSCQCIFGS